MADTKLTALTELSVPALDDSIYAVDKSDTTDDAAGSSRKITVERLLAIGLHSVAQGRLTTETGVAVSTSDRTAQATIYFTPYIGNRIALYDGTRWGFFTFTERSLALSGLTSGKNYDVFIYDNAGTLTLELSAAWTTDIARDDALTTQDGISVKSGATTRRFIGTIRTTGTTTTEDSLTKRFVWNAYNQVMRSMKRFETTSTWTYTTDTWREANGSSTNRLELVCGLVGQSISVFVNARVNNSNGNIALMSSLGYDSTSSPSSDSTISRQVPAAGLIAELQARIIHQAELGYHYYAWLERSAATGTSTWNGLSSGVIQCGINGVCKC